MSLHGFTQDPWFDAPTLSIDEVDVTVGIVSKMPQEEVLEGNSQKE